MHSDRKQIGESVGEAGGVERDEREEFPTISLLLCLSVPSLSLFPISVSLCLFLSLALWEI